MICEGIRNKKGIDIIVINLMNILNAPCSFFVICTGTSQTHINAISNGVQDILKEKLNLTKWKEEGKGSNWHLLDYSDIVIHILKEETRNFYALEDLWKDGQLNEIT